jgi:LacI family transcriptional regulator, repressor for deo operon, udp, cdd, tsx, nupC, and nupG
MANRNDVARLAGVSGTTVTRVLNNSGFIADETRKKVMDAVQQLDYHPNYSGRVLRGQSTRQILFYCPGLFNPFYVHVYYGMDDYAQKYDYSVILTRHFDKNMLQQRRFDGVILSVNDVKDYGQKREFLSTIKMPVVGANFLQARLDIPFVRLDFEQGGRQAAEHLYALGHRSILYASDNNVEDYKWHAIRKMAQEMNMQANRLSISPGPEAYENLHELGHVYAERIHRMNSLPTAVVSANDAVSLGLLSGLYQLGLRVPDDISVVSFDDIMLARYTIPPLTTVHFPKYEMGYELMHILHCMICKIPYEGQQTITTRLIVRQSTRSIL